MKLLERLRWLPTDTLMPGTADVSGKSWVLPMLVGETPGIRSASSRKLRPLSGRLRISVCETVPAIWLLAASSTAASALTVTLASMPPTVSVTGSSNAEPTVSVSTRVTSLNPCRWTVIS
jgi:hypothetical protein